MKLLLFSDLHADRDAMRSLAKRASRFDALVGAGDFCNARNGLSEALAALTGVTTPTVLVAGNNETTDELRAACANWPAARVLHGTHTEVAGVTFFGVGGGIPVTPFGPWSYDFSDADAEALLAPCPVGCVLVVHSPPKGCVDVSSRGASIGSEAIRACIERVRPRLVVCGHVHGSGGQVGELFGVPVVNAGPAGIEWELTAGR